MDKLEKLENLYQEFWEDEFKKKGMHNPAKFINTQPFMYRSKELGFIKWLVDNDKIDIDKYYEFMTNENIDISNACGELDMDKEFYYELLMILAVQDNSIEFLISILR